jgi:hypothetical protein
MHNPWASINWKDEGKTKLGDLSTYAPARAPLINAPLPSYPVHTPAPGQKWDLSGLVIGTPPTNPWGNATAAPLLNVARPPPPPALANPLVNAHAAPVALLPSASRGIKKLIWISHGCIEIDYREQFQPDVNYNYDFKSVSFYAPKGYILGGPRFEHNYTNLAPSICENKTTLRLEHDKDSTGSFHLHPMEFVAEDADKPDFRACFGVYECEDGVVSKLQDWAYIRNNSPFTLKQVFDECQTYLKLNGKTDYEINIWACRGKCNKWNNPDFDNNPSMFPMAPNYKGRGGGEKYIEDIETIKNLQRNAFEDSTEAIPVTQEQLLYYLSQPEEPTPEQIVQQFKPREDIKVSYYEKVFTGGKRRNRRSRNKTHRKNKKSNKKSYKKSNKKSYKNKKR